MRAISRALFCLVVFAVLSFYPPELRAQPVFDLPVSEFDLTPFLFNDAAGFTNTLQVGDLDQGIINPVTGEPLNDVAFVSNPVDTSTQQQDQLTVRIFTIYHTSESDTRALDLNAPADLIYPADTDHLSFVGSSSVQILDLDRDGQNDLAFNGIEIEACSPWECGPSPILGVLGQETQPFVGGEVDMLGRTLNSYSFPFIVGVQFYSGQPSLAKGDMNGNGHQDLVINDWDFGGNGSASLVGGAGNDGQMLRTFLNDGDLGPLDSLETMIDIPDPADDLSQAIPHFIVVGDFDMNGVEDAAVVYVLPIADDEAEIRLMVYPGKGDGEFDANPTISQSVLKFATGMDETNAPNSFTYGDFDGNGHLDFALSYGLDISGEQFVDSQYFTAVITCSEGTPPTCSVEHNEFPKELIVLSLDAGDFDGDGLDDLVQLEVLCTEFEMTGGQQDDEECVDGHGQASAYLNQGGTIDATADQTVVPSVAKEGNTLIPIQVIARDIDGCSPEDIAFTGLEAPFSGGTVQEVKGRGVVAFATAGDPSADAGTGVSTGGGVQLGGDPTCFDAQGNPLSIAWTQTSGSPATISDPTAPNPVVSDLSGEATFQVTCRTACGQASDTVTLGGLILQGSGTVFKCSMNGNAPPRGVYDLGAFLWLLLMALGWFRLRRGK